MAQPQGDSKLRGLPPALFDGNRKKSEDFLREFQLFRGLNENHELMTNPYFRSMLALSYMRGHNIKDWVEDQANDLRTKTTRAQNQIARTDEALWTDFLAEFNRTFTDTTRQQTAYHQLYQWKMQKDDLDNYYSRFQHLASCAGFDRDARATIDLFAKGLKPQLLQAILNRDTTPTTMDEWIQAARREQQKYALKQTMLHPGKSWPIWETRSPKSNGGRTRRHPNDETVPMDVDSPTYTWVGRTWSEAEKRKLSKEGRCFQCGDRKSVV